MSLNPSKSSRFGTSKVRTGCLTCVKRHVKCDETKPECRRCLKAGRSCQWRDQNGTANSHMRIVHYVSQPVKTLKILPFEDTVELRYLEYFRTRTAPDIAGVHNPDLWTYHIMQVALAEPAIWHATLALGALHERFEHSPSMSLSAADMQYPLTHYGKAIKILCDSIKCEEDNLNETPLLACAMFCAFESMGYHLHSALSHLTSGLKVMTVRKRAFLEGRKTDQSIHMLWPLFTRLDTQRLEIGDASFPANQPLMMQYRRAQSTKSMIKKADFTEARYAFDSTLNALMHHVKHLYDPDPHIPDKAKSCLEGDVGLKLAIQDYLRWTFAFESIVSSVGVLSDVPSALLLQVWRLLVNVMLRRDVDEEEMGYDQFESDFRLISTLIEEFLCWTAHYTGPSDELFADPETNSVDEPLSPDTVEHHTAATCQSTQMSGFLGINLEHNPYIDDVRAEAFAALESGQSLLAYSQKARRGSEDIDTGRSCNDCSPRKFKPTFTFSHGIIFPLFAIATRCRDPVIRRRAWILLHRCNRREGLWDSALCARLARRIIQIEESQARQSLLFKRPIASAEQIPNSARIKSIRPTFLPNRRSIERYYFSWMASPEEESGTQETWVEESMEW